MQEVDNNVSQKFCEIEAKLDSIIERNRKVELEKGWETSTTRKFAIVILTYLLMCLVFYMIGVSGFMLNAIVPTIGYYLSTQSLPILKSWWIKQAERDYGNKK